ncbi:MAG: 50S ribosomal protein L27 [Minisyncoccia bacterium]|jgi:large subunit ribosomal protein L27
MAHTKAKGTTTLGRESESKRLGVKLSDGQKAVSGNIIIRQRGTKYIPGIGSKIGKDDTIYAVKNGLVKFISKKKMNFNGKTRLIKVVSVV